MNSNSPSLVDLIKTASETGSKITIQDGVMTVNVIKKRGTRGKKVNSETGVSEKPSDDKLKEAKKRYYEKNKLKIAEKSRIKRSAKQQTIEKKEEKQEEKKEVVIPVLDGGADSSIDLSCIVKPETEEDFEKLFDCTKLCKATPDMLFWLESLKKPE